MNGWDALEMRCRSCTACPLWRTRTNVVFGKGSREAEVLFVGEGPGAQEDLQGVPFVGAAGKLLDDMLSIIDLSEDNCYVANVVKCRPPQNRDPLPEEQEACITHLYEQMYLLKPKIVVCLGRIAAKRLIRGDFRITQEHGILIRKDGLWTTALYHPAALLRDEAKRPETFRDLLALREKIRAVCTRTY